jgi:hypothetical protein
VSEFCCPKCGSPFFRTVSATDELVLLRQCKGALIRFKDYTGCDFTWPSTDDAQYGLEAPPCTTE